MKNSKQFDLSIEEDLKAYSLSEDCAQIFVTFLREGRSTVLFKNKPLLTSNGCGSSIITENNLVFCLSSTVDTDAKTIQDLYHAVSHLDYCVPSGVLINCKKRTPQIKNFKMLVLVNGDIDVDNSPQYSLLDDVSGEGMPTTSFNCLNMFYLQGEGLSRLASGELKVVDYTLDEIRNLTSHDRKVMSRKKNNVPLPPEPGFTLVNNRWHRSGTVLLQDKDRKMCIIMGQDEGTYFGCELPKMVKTIPEAYVSLIPEEIREVPFQRQGEWFMIEVDSELVPDHKNCIAEADEIYLQIDSDDSNLHSVYGDQIRVGQDGFIYAKSPSVTHDQHESINGDSEKWYTFYKNTALRSFSQEGVD